MKNIFKALLISILVSLSFVSCGSSSSTATGGSANMSNINTIDNGLTYDLQNIWTKHDYSFYSSAISSANSDNYTYSASTTKQDDTILNGVNVHHIRIINAFTNTSVGSVKSANRSLYYNEKGIAVQETYHDSGTICTLTNTPTPLNSNAQIGDSGVGSNMLCTDGERYTSIWTLIQVGADATFEEVYKYYDSGDNIYATSTERYIIDTSGTLIKYSATSYNTEDKITITTAQSSVNIR